MDSLSWKKGLISGAINRAKIICSSNEALPSEVLKLKEIFWKNGYSKLFFHKIFSYFEEKNSSLVNDSVDDPYQRYIIKIPYEEE